MFTGCAYEILSVKLEFCIFTTLCILALLTEKIDNSVWIKIMVRINPLLSYIILLSLEVLKQFL